MWQELGDVPALNAVQGVSGVSALPLCCAVLCCAVLSLLCRAVFCLELCGALGGSGLLCAARCPLLRAMLWFSVCPAPFPCPPCPAWCSVLMMCDDGTQGPQSHPVGALCWHPSHPAAPQPCSAIAG